MVMRKKKKLVTPKRRIKPAKMLESGWKSEEF